MPGKRTFGALWQTPAGERGAAAYAWWVFQTKCVHPLGVSLLVCQILSVCQRISIGRRHDRRTR